MTSPGFCSQPGEPNSYECAAVAMADKVSAPAATAVFLIIIVASSPVDGHVGRESFRCFVPRCVKRNVTTDWNTNLKSDQCINDNYYLNILTCYNIETSIQVVVCQSQEVNTSYYLDWDSCGTKVVAGTPSGTILWSRMWLETHSWPGLTD